MDFELIILNIPYILEQFWWNLVSKEWHKIIKKSRFIYKLKYHEYEHINYLKEKYIKIQIRCYPPKDITNVSMLGELHNLHTLDISGCKNITDVSKLG